MRTAVVLFNRDLRVHDHPALHRALREADQVVPLFVLDVDIEGRASTGPNRMAFLHDCLEDLRASLRLRGGDLVVRRGHAVAETMRIVHDVGARAVHVSADVSGFARGREADLGEACASARVEFDTAPGVTVVPSDEVRTGSGGEYQVFTPFWRAWRAHPWRAPVPAPTTVAIPPDLAVGEIPARAELVTAALSPHLARGGETAARALVDRWERDGLRGYVDAHDDLSGDATSRLSPSLHFGCISPLEIATRWRDLPGGDAYVRQLAWRDFHHQTTLAFPAIGLEELRPRRDRWRVDPALFDAWKHGETGYPIVDAGMRQLLAEGWMHNRARMITASFITKTLYLDWRLGAAHFLRWLVDGDIANNSANWQWVAGTGTDTRPNRILNPLRQAERFDPHGRYVRRYLPELAAVDDADVQHPWTMPALWRAEVAYPERIVDHEDAARGFRAVRDARAGAGMPAR